MDSYLLTTKLRIPPLPQRTVQRNRLIDLLEREISHYKLLWISTPAGYGKTTLLSQWVQGSSYTITWLSISEEDNDVDRFFRYLLMTWEQVQPGVGESKLGLLLGAMAPDSDAVLSAFVNVANEMSDHLVFVLDDYHLIEDTAIHQALTFLLDHLPPTLHFVLAGRAAPPLPLARYRTRQQLMELQAEELSFSLEETQAFLNEMMGLELANEEVLTLQAQVEGWIAGLQLVALGRQRHLAAVDQMLVSGRHRFIADYLGDDVLAPLPDNLQQFLLQTSILDRLCGSLCDAVTGEENGQELLKTLEHDNLFLVPLDDSREWYRYHRLFADFLQEELKRRHPNEIVHLHRQAARWYLEHDLPEPAFRHAVDGENVELVIQIAELYFPPKLFGGEVRVVERWLESLPEAWYASHPMLGLVQAIFLVITGAFDACVRCLDKVEQRLMRVESEDRQGQLGKVAMLRCALACFQNDLARAEMYADQALRDLREDDLSYRADIYHALGDTYRGHGQWGEARSCYLKVLDFPHDSTTSQRSAHVFGALADLELRRGRLQAAANYWRKALAAIQDQVNWGRLPLPVTGWVYIRMGELLYEWNELAAAWDHLSRGLERAELGGDVRALIAGYLMADRVKLAQGDIEAAEAYLEQARPLVAEATFPEWSSRCERCQLELWLAQDRLRAAVTWADEMLQGDTLEERPESEVAQLAMARVLIVKGDAPAIERALLLLDGLLQAAEAKGRMGITIEVLALLALAYWHRGDHAEAMIALERALRLAEPEGYVRLFADLGLPMARLLQEARSRAVLPDYVAKLLAAFGGDGALPASAQQALPEPLTEREAEVLELIAAGLTNREIAEALVVSPETIKKHTGNIYNKLSVRSRTEAAARARELKLLG